MSQAVQSAPAPAPAPAPATSVAPTSQPQSTKPARSTPQQLRRLSTGMVATGLVVGLLGALVFTVLTYSLARAQDDTEQLAEHEAGDERGGQPDEKGLPPALPAGGDQDRGQLQRHHEDEAEGVEQRPFVQIFLDTVPESEGSVTPPPSRQVALHNGRLFTLKFAEQALFTPDV